jgi:hypothetical protein
MGHKKFVIGVIGVLFIIGLSCFGCDNGTNNNESNYENQGGVYLTGTYGRRVVSSATVNDRLVFTETTFSSTDRSGPFLSGTYKYDGAILTLTISGIKHNKYANLSGTTLTISGGDGYSEYFNDAWTPR